MCAKHGKPKGTFKLKPKDKKIFHFAALEFWRQLISSPGLNLQDWLEHTFKNSQPASRASQPRTSHQAASRSARHSNTIWEWGTRSGLQKPWGWRTKPITALISTSHQITLCSPCILQNLHIYRLSICGGHHHHHVGCHGTQRRPSEVEAMEVELESDKSGPVCIVNRYRHSKRQRMMEKQLEQNDQRTSFAAGSHDFQESPTHTSVGGKRRHEP